jgi:hypothetical protein
MKGVKEWIQAFGARFFSKSEGRPTALQLTVFPLFASTDVALQPEYRNMFFTLVARNSCTPFEIAFKRAMTLWLISFCTTYPQIVWEVQDKIVKYLESKESPVWKEMAKRVLPPEPGNAIRERVTELDLTILRDIRELDPFVEEIIKFLVGLPKRDSPNSEQEIMQTQPHLEQQDQLSRLYALMIARLKYHIDWQRSFVPENEL